MKNNGISNEKRLVEEINGKTILEVNNNIRSFLKELFGNIDEEVPFKASLFTRTAKPDIYITYKNRMKFISVKSGKTDAMHLERIKDFILFLRELGVSKETQKTILLFHYGDGTLTGEGKVRKPYEELINEMKNQIKKANEELNSSKIITEMFYRSAIKGNEYRSNGVDYFYYGNAEYGVYTSKEELLSFILRKKHYSFNTIHIGPMTIQPYLRDVNHHSKNTFKREFVQVKWHYFLADMENAKCVFRV